MAPSGWVADYPAASNFITGLVACDAPLAPTGGFCDAGIDALIDHALEVQADEPVAAGALWSEVDRAIVHQAPYLWLVNPMGVEFVSERVGNYQRGIPWGVLLNQLWVR
jgi:hypothetical protein